MKKAPSNKQTLRNAKIFSNYMWGDDTTITLGKKYGLTPQRIYQIIKAEERAFEKATKKEDK